MGFFTKSLYTLCEALIIYIKICSLKIMNNHFRVTQTLVKTQTNKKYPSTLPLANIYRIMNQIYPQSKSFEKEQMAINSHTRASNWSKTKLREEETLKSNQHIISSSQLSSSKRRLYTPSAFGSL